ncbi:mechanosensitive ion channel family protein [Streptacidiphilus pinicola]|uniref:mechanosensitive ion channel family protein n=1 Tax=Streptacidiphilus pinicola TaxID=2219663 RepID=UPI0026949713
MTNQLLTAAHGQAQQLALSVDFGSGFTNAFNKVISFVPKFIGFLAILVIG